MNQSKPYRLVAFRFSSLGDVAMTVPVIREFLQQNPEVEMIYVSRDKFKPLFEEIPRLTFYPADLNGNHKGVWGLRGLYKELIGIDVSGVADLHNVLRTKILDRFFNFSRIPVSVLDKGRKERKNLIQSKIKQPIKSMPERYADVFRSLGFKLILSNQLKENKSEKENAIGIAPFAMYEGKMYPLERMKIVAQKMAESGLNVYLFGGKEEAKELADWEKLNPNIISVAGKFDLKEELGLIKKLKLMVSMDSANMHLASIVGTRVISIWGNTHPFMGFLGYGQKMNDVIQDETLTKRPTSVFGKESKSNINTDYFKNISAETIIEKLRKFLY